MKKQELENSIKSTRLEVAKLEGQVDAIDEKLMKLVKRFNGMREKVDEIEDIITNRLIRFGGLNDKLVELDSRQSTCEDNLMHLEERFNELKNQPEDGADPQLLPWDLIVHEDGADLQLVPWNYEEWKKDPKGWQAVTRDGREVKHLTEFDVSDNESYSLAGVLDGYLTIFILSGRFHEAGRLDKDITHMRRVS